MRPASSSRTTSTRGRYRKLKGFVQAQSWFQDLTPIVIEGPTN